MITYVSVGVGAFVAGGIVGCVLLVLILRGKRSIFPQRTRRTRKNLNRFNFDKQKRYEKEGRKYPFSY